MASASRSEVLAVMSDKKNGGGVPALPSPYFAQDPDVLARNLGKAMEEGGRALAAYLAAQAKGKADGELSGPSAEVLKTVAKVGQYWSADPLRIMAAQTSLFSSYLAVWSHALSQARGEKAEPAFSPKPGDRRFNDPEWTRNPVFSALKQFYLATAFWAEDLVDRAEDLDEHTRHKARFYVEQINNALSPSNFALTNPEVLRETAASNAENLVRGMRMLAEDIETGGGALRIRRTDAKAFKVGENLASTPGKVIFQNDICQIIQYAPMTEKVLKRPLLVVPPWINKFYVLDMAPDKSLIRWMIEQGHTVFIISWVNPDERHAEKSFEHYMREGILQALDTIKEATGEAEVNALGYCVGGTLLAVTLGYMAATGDDRIVSATFLTTQVDFEHAGDLKVFADADQIASLEADMAKTGYLAGSRLATAFNLMRSNDLIWPYVVNNYMKGKEPLPFDLLYWNSDATRMPAANHSFYLRNCYLENNLSKGRMVVAGERIDLGKVTIPVYNLATREDHIAPAKSVFLGSSAFGGPVRFVMTGSGHIAGVVNPPAKKKYQYWTGEDPEGSLEDWLDKAEEHVGSWWGDWQQWIEGLDNRRARKRRPGGTKLKPIEDAPGSYVRASA